jgi:hypothetical protein
VGDFGAVGVEDQLNLCKNYYTFSTVGIFPQGTSLTQKSTFQLQIIQNKEDSCGAGRGSCQGTKYRRILSSQADSDPL